METISHVASGIKISVQTQLNEEATSVDQNRFFFNYHIQILNNNDFPVRLLRRHWEIFDSLHPRRIVDGEGVVGLSPLLKPGGYFSYSSGCDLYSELGSMKGYYIFERLDILQEFHVPIPKFDLIFYGRLN
jgi:ApaG protein